MWVCFNNAFVSIVADKNDPNRLLVRARRREHLTNLFGRNAEILEDAGTDYKYRIFADRRSVADLVHKALLNISYTNFKSSVRDHTLHNLYSDFWGRHYGIQE